MEWSSPDSVIGKPIVVERSAYEQIKDASRFSNDSAKQEALLAEAKHDHTVLRTSGHLRFNRAFVMRCVAANGHALAFADPRLLRDRSVVLAAVSSDSMMIAALACTKAAWWWAPSVWQLGGGEGTS